MFNRITYSCFFVCSYLFFSRFKMQAMLNKESVVSLYNQFNNAYANTSSSFLAFCCYVHLMRAHRCHGKCCETNTFTERAQMFDLPTRFHLSHLILFFSVALNHQNVFSSSTKTFSWPFVYARVLQCLLFVFLSLVFKVFLSIL